jgi:hypothetical protein
VTIDLQNKRWENEEQNPAGPKSGRQDSALFILKQMWETYKIDLKDTSRLYIINRPQTDMKKGNKQYASDIYDRPIPIMPGRL